MNRIHRMRPESRKILVPGCVHLTDGFTSIRQRNPIRGDRSFLIISKIGLIDWMENRSHNTKTNKGEE